MMKQQHEYVINHWFGGRGEGTTCLFRTTSKKEWIKKIKELRKKFAIQKKYAKTIVWYERTIFSFATGGGVNLWAESQLIRKPIQVLYGIPKEADE